MILRRLLLLAFASLLFATCAAGDEITFTAVNLSHATFTGSDVALMFGNAINVLVTDNTTGKSEMLLGVQSGNTGAASHFDPGPPLIADYLGSGTSSVLIASTGHTFLSGEMADSGRFEADYPNGAGAFLSRFHVTFVDPAVLAALGTSAKFAPDGSISLTVAETSFNSGTLTATLGGSHITIETEAPVPEVVSMFLLGTGIIAISLYRRSKGVQA